MTKFTIIYYYYYVEQSRFLASDISELYVNVPD